MLREGVWLQDMQDVVAQCLEKDPAKRPTASALLKHRFFKWTRAPRDAVEELLTGMPGPVQRLTSLTRRSREKLPSDDDIHGFGSDERVSLGSLKVHSFEPQHQRLGIESMPDHLHGERPTSTMLPMPPMPCMSQQHMYTELSLMHRLKTYRTSCQDMARHGSQT